MPTIDPCDMTAADYLRWERVGWLRALVSDFRALRELATDPDPTATAECLREVEALADELESELPQTREE